MNVYLIVVPCALAVVALVGMLVLAACGVDGFRGDETRHRTVYVAAPAPMPQRAPQGPLRVVARRVDQVEAAA